MYKAHIQRWMDASGRHILLLVCFPMARVFFLLSPLEPGAANMFAIIAYHLESWLNHGKELEMGFNENNASVRRNSFCILTAHPDRQPKCLLLYLALLRLACLTDRHLKPPTHREIFLSFSPLACILLYIDLTSPPLCLCVFKIISNTKCSPVSIKPPRLFCLSFWSLPSQDSCPEFCLSLHPSLLWVCEPFWFPVSFHSSYTPRSITERQALQENVLILPPSQAKLIKD